MVAQFKSIPEFLAMGGYAGFVFSAWGLSLGVIVILIARAFLVGRQQKIRLQELERDPRS
jgi:heme exporter protein D